MAPRARPRANRLLLWVWVVFSLVSVGYSLLLYAASLPVSDEAAEAMRHGNETTLDPRNRLVVSPLSGGDPRTVAGFGDGDRPFGAKGDLVVWSNATRTTTRDLLPFETPQGRVARALALVSRNASGGWDVPALNASNVTTIVIPDVPGVDETGAFAERNLTLDLDAFAGEGGYVLKADAEREPVPRLVPRGEVVGRVIREVPAVSVWVSLALSILGTLVPLVLIITTHRGRGKRGMPGAGGATGPACPECGRPAVEGTEFCVRCGALLRRGDRPLT